MIMFCKNCGAALPEGALFCGACGTAQAAPAAPAPVAEVPAPVVEAPVAPAPVAEVPAPVVEAPAAPAPVAEVPAQPAFVDPFAPAEPEAPAKPKKKGKGLLIAGIAVLAAAAVFVTCVAGPLWFGWFPNTKLAKQVTKWFGSDEAYMSAVEAETVDALSNTISKGYGSAITTAKDILAGNKYASTTISLEMGDALKEMIRSAINEAVGSQNPAMDAAQISQLISLLDGASVSVAGGKADDVFGMAFGIGLGGEEIVKYDVITDMLNLKMYMAIPTFSDTYLDLSELFADVDLEDTAAVAQATDLLEALPSEEVVNNLLKKYIQLALDQFTDVSKESDTIKVGGIEEKVTVLETKIGPKDLVKAAKAVVKELKNDSEVKKVLISMGDAIGAMNGQEGYGEQLYESLQMGLEQIAPMLDSAAESGDEGSYLLMTDYVNNAHEIVGRKIALREEDEKQEILYYATATKGKDYAFEMEVRGVKVLTGKGTNQKGIINGTYTVDGSLIYGMQGSDESMPIATIKVENFDSNGIKEGRMKGTFTITPAAEIMEQLIDGADLPAEVTSALSLLDCSLKIETDVAADGNGYYKVSVCNGSKTLLGLRVDVKITDEKVSVPTPDKTVSLENMDAWVDTFDLSKFVASLKKIGLPDEWTSALDSAEATEAFKEAFKEAFSNGLGGNAVVKPDVDWDDNKEYDDWDDDYEVDWGDVPSVEEDWNDYPSLEDSESDGSLGLDDFYGEDVATEVDTDGDGVIDGIDVDGDGIADYYVDEDGYVYAVPVNAF